jgi:hypothetical protein
MLVIKPYPLQIDNNHWNKIVLGRRGSNQENCHIFLAYYETWLDFLKSTNLFPKLYTRKLNYYVAFNILILGKYKPPIQGSGISAVKLIVEIAEYNYT